MAPSPIPVVGNRHESHVDRLQTALGSIQASG